MKSYIAVTGLLFAVLVVAHVWRAIAERMILQANPVFVTTTVVSAALAVWAIVLLRRAR